VWCRFEPPVVSQASAWKALEFMSQQTPHPPQRETDGIRRLLAHQADGIVILDPHGAVLYANPAAEALFERTAAELLGELIGFPLVVGEWTEVTIIARSGELRIAEMRAVDIEWDGRRAYLASFHDITALKRAAQLDRDRNQVLEMVARNTSIVEILHHLAGMVEHQRPGLIGSILLARDGRLYHAAAKDVPEAFLQAIDGAVIAHDSPLPLARFFSHEPDAYISPDIGADENWAAFRELAARHELHACWALPFFSGAHEMLGVFAAYLREPRAPSTRDIELIAAASNLAAIAVEHRQLTDRLYHQAQHDALTGLPNRLLFHDRLNQAIMLARRHQNMAGLIYLDLDRFKIINDTLGHGIGDGLLQQVAERLERNIRQNDTLARMGGDEFTLVLNELNGPQGAVRVAQKLLAAFQKPFFVDAHELYVTASIGVSVYPADGDTPEELLRTADNALYRSKERGRNTYQLYSNEMSAAIHERLAIENALRFAQLRNEFSVHYQPQIDLESRRLSGVEALLRWRSEQYGVVPPDRFIPIAEENGLIVPIGGWCLAQACRETHTILGELAPSFKVAVNVSALQFARADFVEQIIETLQTTGLAPTQLELELVESTVVRDISDTIAKLNRLRAIGVDVAIDDFGTGYSSLAYLQRLPISTLKIDRVFVREMASEGSVGRNSRGIVRAIIMLAQHIGIRVIAEGVETEEQLQYLSDAGCSIAQGYLFSKPLPATELQQHAEQIRQAAGKALERAGRRYNA
jgi:diguanylate cyclase (GGDEF)-like protein